MSVTSGRKRMRRPSRRLAEPLRTAKGRSLSSSRWLQRQRNDPYVLRAQEEGLRSRSAYKLIEIDERFRLLGNGKRVLDLGAAPGGWCQAAVAAGCAPVVGVDLLPVDPIPGVFLILGDMRDDAVLTAAREALDGPAHAVLSDMAAPATGHRSTDRFRVSALAEEAASTARQLLAPGGCFVAKVMRSGTPDKLLADLRSGFRRVRHFKPQASRPESDEIYIVATDYRESVGA